MTIRPTAMQEARFALAVSLFVILVAIGVWDIMADFYEQPQYTISNLIADMCERYPVLYVGIGLILGHLFWPRTLPPQ